MKRVEEMKAKVEWHKQHYEEAQAENKEMRSELQRITAEHASTTSQLTTTKVPPDAATATHSPPAHGAAAVGRQQCARIRGRGTEKYAVATLLPPHAPATTLKVASRGACDDRRS
jgi:septal ring factor EnvC (AmiA/AmiB activator)